jgi:hypothetical protein
MSEKKKVGRKPRPIVYQDVVYNDKHYIVGVITSNKGLVKFVFDKEDEDKVKKYSWFITSVGYISSHHSIEKGIRGQLLLHRLILDIPYFPGKGAKETVDHINRNPLDNRKENLRIVSQIEQNLNQKKKSRIVELPDGCGIAPNDIPKHVWYVRANGAHGDRFAIEFKTENILWKSSSSKKLSLQEKLDQAKQKLHELYQIYPYLNPSEETRVAEEAISNTTFSEVLTLANI